ncbi:uncharacterized protein TRIADDRAFT_62528 [Trichoplax adhaerens]|uniref:G-protein coupled receptors family 1 profile domain-containing protein n=1 Tax=Trichoplax adhaerens TaxID=10228 RepID=B3SE22_TRIAD|nr:hypothetical protein TRIADDRAFT_62528 [Trichoplax adhaerens]EDV19023.1 hypothetical protein TRIADDRAFT_62528 [Trichoplax adhaerens]|eukprot:XP_002118491.1 hypothetical protein TRIADDRAFT_62528 [Trichoplax adhaerens]
MATITTQNSTWTSNASKEPGFITWERLSPNDPRFILAVIFCSFICFIAIFGNLRNLIMIYNCRRLHDMNNLCICNLAVVDFLTGLIVIPLGISTLAAETLGYLLCQIQGFFTLLLYLSSLAATSIISVDRCSAVVNPFGYKSHITVSKCAFIATFTWFIPSIISILPLLGFERIGLGKFYVLLLCGISFDHPIENFIVSWILTIFLVVNIVTICMSYLVIFIVAYRKTVQDLTRNSKLSRSIRTTGLIVGTNFLFWLPYIVLNVQDFVYNTSVPPVPTTLNYFTTIACLMALSSPAINPIIYAATSKHLRKRFTRVGIPSQSTYASRE